MTDELKQKLTEKFNSAYGEEVKIGLRDALRKVYIHGGEYGYQYAVDKACEWVKRNVLEFEHQSFGHEFDDCVEDFRKAMEE